MEENKEKLYVMMRNENGEESNYSIEQIFGVEGTEQLYCIAVPTNDGNSIFLKCKLVENEDNTEIELSDFSEVNEYNHVVEAYNSLAEQMSFENTRDELLENDDYITVKNKEGNNVDLILHTIFEDEKNNRSYVAVQIVDDEGNISEEISLYRFFETDTGGDIEMIPSDMEYERARNLFIQLIEQ